MKSDAGFNSLTKEFQFHSYRCSMFPKTIRYTSNESLMMVLYITPIYLGSIIPTYPKQPRVVFIAQMFSMIFPDRLNHPQKGLDHFPQCLIRRELTSKTTSSNKEKKSSKHHFCEAKNPAKINILIPFNWRLGR